jgi:hypothetical protein
MADREERAKEANRDDHASRSRQWATVGSDDLQIEIDVRIPRQL